MDLDLIRFSSGKNDTLGLLYIDRVFQCYTLEDEFRTEKVMGKTRIPEGKYELKLRKEGEFHQRYAQRFPAFHKGMLHLQNVPGFTYVLIHIGNDEDDTAGCLLVGNSSKSNVTSKGFIGESTKAYRFIYPKIANELELGHEVFITIKDIIVKY